MRPRAHAERADILREAICRDAAHALSTSATTQLHDVDGHRPLPAPPIRQSSTVVLGTKDTKLAGTGAIPSWQLSRHSCADYEVSAVLS
jgi:hypothetical protein